MHTNKITFLTFFIHLKLWLIFIIKYLITFVKAKNHLQPRTDDL